MSEQERRWEYAVVEIGHASPEVEVEVTGELIAGYAGAVRNDNPAYSLDDGAVPAHAMPSTIFRVAPLRRGDIAANNGYVAQEHARENPFQTPFAKCEVRWFAPMRAGDTITSFGHVVDKYERRGNKFVTIRVEANNQAGEKVGEYDYTCIFEYAQGQKRPD